MNQNKNQELEQESTRYVWHPFTQMREWEYDAPTIIDRGKGPYLYDIHGNVYLDGVSSIWVNLHGHQKQRLNGAIKQQLSKIAHSTLLGLTHVPAVRLAKRLIDISPKGLAKVFYSDNGSTAVEIAIKMALQYWQLKGQPRKTRYLSLAHSYHGDTVGSVSLGGIDLFHERFKPLLFQSLKVGAPYCYRCFLGKTYPTCQLACFDEMERIVKKHHQDLAALVVEPMIQGAGGMIIWPPGYLTKIRSLCSHFGVLMIADEVMTGFGRTGKMFACNHEEVTPDLLAVAKGLTGGYLPLAATLTTQEIYDAFLGRYDQFKTFFHGHSFTGNQLGCAAALANLDVFEEEKVLEKLEPKIAHLSRSLRSLENDHPVGDIRQLGFIAAVELVRQKETREAYPLSERIGHRVALEAKRRGMLIRPLGHVMVLMPPLSISKRLIRKMVSILRESILAATKGSSS